MAEGLELRDEAAGFPVGVEAAGEVVGAECDCDRYLAPGSGICPVFLFDINLCLCLSLIGGTWARWVAP